MLKNIELKDMKISKIEYSGVSDLIYFLRSNLNIPITKGTKDAFIVKISLRENASSVTKDTAGVTTQEKITISIAFEILDTKNNTIGKESITDSKTVRITNNISTDAEIKRVEKENIITNLIQQLTFAIRAKIISSQK
tara:strand:- start:1998 stop:2411 length:414 start_codon:yes stop_codon:yes gene_type:complete